MKTILLPAAFAAVVLSTPAFGQAVPAAKVAVVDLDRIGRDCNACRTASAALQAQANAFNTRRQTLTTQLQPERTALETAVRTLGTKQPDAALTKRIQDFQQKEAAASQELSRQQNQVQRNQAFISQQVQEKLQPLLRPAMQRRGANLLVESGATLASETALDITTDVLTALNGVLTTIQTTAPAAAQQPTQGR